MLNNGTMGFLVCISFNNMGKNYFRIVSVEADNKV
jgi:hypothetical protein